MHLHAFVIANTLLAGIATAGAPAPVVPPAATPVVAQEWFEVEVLVFRHTQPGAGASETWLADPGRPAVDGARELDASRTVLEPYLALPRANARLNDAWNRFVKSSRYEPIAWFGWLQPPVDRGKETAVRLASPAPAPASEPAAAPASNAPPFAFAPTSVAGDAVVPALPPLRTPLDGIATVGLQRYLYVTLDLVFQPADAPATADGGAAPPFRLTETRRLRSKELHYFDHPMFSALVLITPRPAPPELIDPATGLPKPVETAK